MRLIILLFFLISAPPALARIPPGPPPWICSPYAACDENNFCVSIHVGPLQFILDAVQNEENKFTMEGFYGNKDLATAFPSREEARLAVETDSPEGRTGTILIPDDGVSDAHGFRLLSTVTSGSGKRSLNRDSLRIACRRLWNK